MQKQKTEKNDFDSYEDDCEEDEIPGVLSFLITAVWNVIDSAATFFRRIKK